MKKKSLIISSVLLVSLALGIGLWFALFFPNSSTNAAPQEPLTETETIPKTEETIPSANEIRQNIRSKCDGTYKDAKRIFQEEYGDLEFRTEYFFTDYELNIIKILEDNGKNKVFHESYNEGWVEIVSLIGEVGDEQTFIAEGDPFVEGFVWK